MFFKIFLLLIIIFTNFYVKKIKKMLEFIINERVY